VTAPTAPARAATAADVSRVQLALNVSDLDAAIAFYSTLFGSAPAKRRPGYANFAITEPPLKLVLIENTERAGTLNHLGVEVASADAVASETLRLAAAGLATTSEDAVECCYAVQDKVWVGDPDGAPWELYTVLGDSPVGVTGAPGSTAGTPACCTSDPASGCC
jgi:catechol 2,3-dioxygenase-like lactoylglutathione lyase family enzyme